MRSTSSVTFTSIPSVTAGFTYSFDFDSNGVFEVVNSPSATATIPATFLPDGPATLTVHGRVTDSHGVSTDYYVPIQIANVVPSVVNLTLDKASYLENDTVTLTGTIADPGQYDWQMVEIDWKDGSPHTVLSLHPDERTFEVTHQYLNNNSGSAPYPLA